MKRVRNFNNFINYYFMKKAKIVLTAIAIFAIAGGAFALKANRANQGIYFGTEAGGATVVYSFGYKTTAPTTAAFTTFATTLSTAPVVYTYVTTGN